MPELPEVETTRRGIAPHLIGQTVRAVHVRQPQLRWPVPAALLRELPGHVIEDVGRRGKYLLLHTAGGTVLVHLGMSGSLRIVPSDAPVGKYDHVDLVLANGECLRLRDPRRFGAVLWTREDIADHKLLANMGPDALENGFNGDYLFRASRGRTRAIRDLLIDSHIVAGIGNIYANEALFAARIHPKRAAGRISRKRYQRLARAVRATLKRAIAAGGTTLRDFRNARGEPGYFQLHAQVYAREGAPCLRCARPIRAAALGGRRVFYCNYCQL